MSSEPLNGYVFVFTGEMAMDREEATRIALFLGARVTKAVSSKTTHVVAGNEPGPSKLEKARQLEVKIINEEEFKILVEKHKAVVKEPINTVLEHEKNEKKQSDEKKQVTEKRIPWVEKYRPHKAEDIIGNNTVLNELYSYLKGETEHKAVLLSGSPGVGKTTAALAACNELGLIPLEFNASDLRSKKTLGETVTNQLGSHSTASGNKRVLVMDEVDGMTSDRGGLPELINIIKKSKIPVICICNDKTHPKMRTLLNYCMDLHVRRLDARSILPRVKYILEQEHKKLPDGVINEITANSHGDMRYILNTIQNLVSRDEIRQEEVTKSLVKKTVLKGIFEIATEIFQKKTIKEKIDLYFEDPGIVPLFVHENYPKCSFRDIRDFFLSAESISLSDVFDTRIHGSEQEWSLMPYHAFFSTVNPVKHKTLSKRLDFPGYLGQQSRAGKHRRLLHEVSCHLRYKMTSKQVRLYGAEVVYNGFVKELKGGRVDKCIEMLVELQLLKDDVMNLGEVTGSEQMKEVAAKHKTALTKAYNKLSRKLPYTEKIEEKVEEEEYD